MKQQESDEPPSPAKREATAIARAALQGFQVHVRSSPRGRWFTLARGGWAKDVADLDALEAFLDRREGPQR